MRDEKWSILSEYKCSVASSVMSKEEEEEEEEEEESRKELIINLNLFVSSSAIYIFPIFILYKWW